MPFTPFHMGAALVVKPATANHFSVIAFGIAQIAMDIEPLIQMYRQSPVLHGPTHTFIGAFIIGLMIVFLSPALCRPILRRYNHEVRTLRLDWLVESIAPSRMAIWTGAMFGTFSHIVLDSFMHDDIRPFAPFSSANPMLHLISHDGVYRLCWVSGLLGMVVWLALKFSQRRTSQ